MSIQARKILGAFAAMVLLTALAACYLPNHFKSEIRLGRNGDFALSFYGEVTWAPLYREIIQGKLKPEEAAAKIEDIRTDLARDKNFSKIESLGQGRFKVVYERQGHLGDNDMVTFVRRNAIILMLVSKPDGTIKISGNTLKPSDAQMATNAGIDIQGEFRVVTDGLVKENNATRITSFNGYQVYIWTIENAFSPGPRLVMQREGVFPATPPKKDKK
jgi:hypothetical protein